MKCCTSICQSSQRHVVSIHINRTYCEARYNFTALLGLFRKDATFITCYFQLIYSKDPRRTCNYRRMRRMRQPLNINTRRNNILVKDQD